MATYQLASSRALLPGVSRRVHLAAHAVPFMTLPSALWRIALLVGLPVFGDAELKPWEYPYIFGLSFITEGLALLTIGLVRPWGETFPSWVPWLAGRRIPIAAVVVPAGLGATALIVLWSVTFYNVFATSFFDNFDGAFQKILVGLAYAPLLAWGPTLAYVTVAYAQRRHAYSRDAAAQKPAISASASNGR